MREMREVGSGSRVRRDLGELGARMGYLWAREKRVRPYMRARE